FYTSLVVCLGGINIIILQVAVKELKELDTERVELQKEGHTLIDFFCEDKETMKLDECFQIFRDFCDKFNKAVKENRERELQDIRQKQRLKELELKRQSWVCVEARGFGRSSSENDVELLTKKGLEEFLLQRPQSPLSRNSSTRRSRHSLGVTADRELLMYLETPQDDQLNKCNSLPRTHTRQSRPTIAWMKDKNEEDNVHLNKNEAIQSSSPLPKVHISTFGDDHTAIANKKNNQTNIDRNNNQPQNCQDYEDASVKKTPLSPLAVSIQERELVKKLQKFDLQGSVHENTEDVCVTDLETFEELGIHSLSLANKLLPPSKNTKDAPSSIYDEDISMTEEYSNSTSTPVSQNTCTSEKEHGTIFYVEDTTEDSLSLDHSEAQSVNCKKGDTSVAMETKSEKVNISADRHKNVDCSTGDAGSTKENTIKSKDHKRQNSVKERTSSFSKSNAARSNTATTKPVRMLNESEHETMRKVVPISKATKSGSIKRTELRSSVRDEGKSDELKQTFRHSLRAKNDNVPRNSPITSPTAEEPKLQRGSSFIANTSRFQRDQIQRKSSVKKPAAKPVRNIAKPKPDETKICRTSPKESNSTETSKPQPTTPLPSPKTLPSTPSFARNTVASSSRRATPEQSSPTTGKTSTITRSSSIRQSKGKSEPLTRDANTRENGRVNTFNRTGSMRTPGKGMIAVGNGTPETVQKEKGIVEKPSVKLKDTGKATLGKILKPLLK
ncbi:hypothetical protein AB205_0212780, partial [Aquarana catesbeiana]